MFISGYANTENVFYCLNIYLHLHIYCVCVRVCLCTFLTSTYALLKEGSGFHKESEDRFPLIFRSGDVTKSYYFGYCSPV